MPPPHHHHGGHIPQSAFWGNWGYPDYSPTYLIEQPQEVPTWVYVAGGALAGMILALLSRGR